MILFKYVDRKEDPLIQDVRTHQNSTDSVESQRPRCLKTEVQKEMRKVKESIAEKTKKMARQENAWTIATNLDETLVVIEQSYRWIKSGDIKGETESTIVAAQDKEISTN